METDSVCFSINPYELLVLNPDSTFFLKEGVDMPEFCISKGDYILVDRQAEAENGKIVIASFDGWLRLMRLIRRDCEAFLSDREMEKEVTELEHVFIWGVIRWILREV